MGRNVSVRPVLFCWLCGFGFDVNGARDLAQLGVRSLFFILGLAQHADGILIAKQLGIGTGRAVSGDFIMLDTLRGGNETGIENIRLASVLDALFAFLEQALHAFASFSFGAFIHALEDLFETCDVVFGFFKVVLKSLLEMWIVGSLDEFGKGLGDLLFGGVQVL